MKKIFLLIWLVVMCIVLGSCGHKSDKELTDIEQFKCSDSIQTVFDILGETEVETRSLEGDLCKYENLNLWGYEGTATFKLRNDKDTIQSFYCSFTLNEKEFEDLLLQFENK